MNIDLHCHSTNSDGTWPVSKLLEEAEKKRIQGLSITDHDNFNGSLEANRVNENVFSGILIPGIEISTRIEGQTVHLLAYFPQFDINQDADLFQNLEKIKESRSWRMKEMIKKAKIKGFEVNFDDVSRLAALGIDGSVQSTDVLSRPHLARVLMEKGYVSSIDEAFDLYLADGKDLHVYRFTQKIDEWVNQIRNLKGLIIWAHPYQGHDEDFDNFMKIANIIQQSKIDGVERIYNYKAKYQVSQGFIDRGNSYIDELITTNDWLITAGGDFHGDVGRFGELELAEVDWHRFLNQLGLI